MKKYIPVFGPQELFDGAAADIIAIRVNDYKKITYYYHNEEDLKSKSMQDLHAIPIVAMRRIEEVPDSQLVTDGMPSFYVGSSGACTHKMAESDIPVWCNDVDDACAAIGFINDCLRPTRKPKRWTVEDQKAGRLPEVGSEVILRTSGEIATINAANKNMVCLTFSDGGFSPFNVERIDPIETPEEKAARLREEWCSKAAKTLKNLEYNSTLTSIYDALLSGELPMPKKEDE